MFVISHDGKRAYTSNVGSGTVSVLDLAARKTVKVIPVAEYSAADFDFAKMTSMYLPQIRISRGWR